MSDGGGPAVASPPAAKAEPSPLPSPLRPVRSSGQLSPPEKPTRSSAGGGALASPDKPSRSGALSPEKPARSAGAPPLSPAGRPSASPQKPARSGGGARSDVYHRAVGRCPACGAAPLTDFEVQIVRKPGRRSTRDANDPRNRPENLVTREFLNAHIVVAQMSLRDIGAFHGYTISTLSRRAKQEGVPVGQRARAEASKADSQGGDEGAAAAAAPPPAKPAAQRPAQRRKPAASASSSRARSGQRADEEDDDISEGEQQWRPPPSKRRRPPASKAAALPPLVPAASPQLFLLQSDGVAHVSAAQLSAQPEGVPSLEQLAELQAQTAAQREASEMWAHVAQQTVALPAPEPRPQEPKAVLQCHEEIVDSDEDEVAQLLGLLRRQSPAPSVQGPPQPPQQQPQQPQQPAAPAAAVPAAAAAAAREDGADSPPTKEEPAAVAAAAAAPDAPGAQQAAAPASEQQPIAPSQQQQPAGAAAEAAADEAGEAAGEPQAAVQPKAEAAEQQPISEAGVMQEADERQPLSAVPPRVKLEAAEPAPSSQADASWLASQAASQQQPSQQQSQPPQPPQQQEQQQAAKEEEVKVEAPAYATLAPCTAPLDEMLMLNSQVEATPPGSPRSAALALPPMSSQTAAAPAPAACAPSPAATAPDAGPLSGGGAAAAGSLSPQLAAVKASAVQLVLERAVESFQFANMEDPESMLLPLRRLLRAGKGGTPLQDVVERWPAFALAKQQDLFAAVVLHATEGHWQALEDDLRLELAA